MRAHITRSNPRRARALGRVDQLQRLAELRPRLTALAAGREVVVDATLLAGAAFAVEVEDQVLVGQVIHVVSSSLP
jgi:hypothetical protein